MNPKFRITRWDPSTIKRNRNILIIGRRGSGKSTILENLLFEQKDHYDIVCGMCPTINSQKMMLRHMPPELIYPDGNSERDLCRMISVQKEQTARGRNRRSLIIWDDCMFDTKIIRSKIMRDLAMNGRQYNITFMNCMQYCLDMPPSIRSQIDYVIVMKENVKVNKEKLHKYFFGVFPSLADFSRTMDRVTENFGALVLDNTSPESQIDKCVYWYRGREEEDIPAFKLCSPVVWALSNNIQTQIDNGPPDDDEDADVIVI